MSGDSYLVEEIESALDSAKAPDDDRLLWAQRSIVGVSSEKERLRLQGKQHAIEQRLEAGRLEPQAS